MEIKKYENYEPNDGFNYPYGSHTFVLARYKNGWNNFRGHFFSYFENDEFIPCKICGTPFTKFDKRDLYIIGDNHSHDINDFEIIPDSNKKIEEIINIYNDSKKYNL
jgi:hypothetical protein